MVDARHRFLASGAYDRVSDGLAHLAQRGAVAAAERAGGRPFILDVGCGEGRHTRRVAEVIGNGGGGLEPLDVVVAGLDVAKPAVALAARLHPAGWYAVTSAGDLPVATASVDVALTVFGPVVSNELARVVRPGGLIVAAHPGAAHLASLRELVYEQPRPHEAKDPLRDAPELFWRVGTMTVTFPITIADTSLLGDLFTMTPYRWHAPPGLPERLRVEAGRPGGFQTEVDVILSSYRRTELPSS
jgi:23S rRNA (guanine745-N1)-methyltransferase